MFSCTAPVNILTICSKLQIIRKQERVRTSHFEYVLHNNNYADYHFR